MNYPKASIIILNWNGLHDTIECLQSVKKTDYPNYEIIVIDNASTDGQSEQIKKMFPEITLIKNKTNLGYVKGNNIGIKYAINNGAYYIWLLNNDAVVEPNTLGELILTGEKSPATGLSSPVLYYYANPSKLQFCGSFYNWTKFSYRHAKDLNELKEIDDTNVGLWGTALLIKRKVIEKIGYLNERYFMYHEDMEYSLRSIKAGYLNRVVLSAKAFHKHHFKDQGGINNLPVHFFYYMTRNEYWLWKENTKGFQKIRLFRKYLAQVIRKSGYFKKNGHPERMNACLDGMYCAFCNISGRWNKNITMPLIIKKLILWHPYFWADLIEVNFKKIIIEISKRVKRKFITINS